MYVFASLNIFCENDVFDIFEKILIFKITVLIRMRLKCY